MPLWSKSRHFRVSKHKGFEFNLYRWECPAPAHFKWTVHRHCDHPGFRLSLTLFRLQFEFHFYDNRHWDKDSGRLED